jgi:amino acid adenylation domain-containing protein
MQQPATAGFPLSSQQKQVWKSQGEGRPAAAQMALLLEGSLDTARLQSALQKLIERHEILRTSFQRSSGMKFPFQVVHDSGSLKWSEEPGSSSEIEELLSERGATLEGVPGLTALLVKQSKDRNMLLLSAPAVCADATSLTNLFSELLKFYAGNTAQASDPLQYADYSEWHNDLLAKEDEESKVGKDFWNKQELEKIPALALSFEKQAEARSEFRAEFVRVALDANVSRVQDPRTFMLACWQALLWRVTGQPEVVLGYVSAGRTHEELDAAVGAFARVLPLHAHFEPETTFVEALHNAEEHRDDCIDAQDYCPLEPLSDGLPIGFSAEERALRESAGGITFSLHTQRSFVQRFHVQLKCIKQGTAWHAELEYDPAVLSREVVEDLARRLELLSAAAALDPGAAVATLPIMDDRERQLVTVGFNQTAAEYPKGKTIHELFEDQAVKHAERPALRFGEQVFSYAELNAKANRLAHFLRKRGVKANVPVGLCVERSAEMIVGLLGILKSGGCYVPLVSDSPKTRLAHQLKETGAPVVLTEKKLLERIPQFGGETVCLDDTNFEGESAENPARVNSPEDLVYVIYTSGSTGTPKGVAVRHFNLVNYSHFICRRLELDKHQEGLNFATVSTISADLGNTCIFPSLISGGCLHVIGYEMAMAANLFAAHAAKHRIDVLKITPSHLASLLNAPEGSGVLPQKYLVLGGEASSWHLMKRIRESGSCAVINHYGPTEATVGCCTFAVNENDVSAWSPATVPIGKPIANDQIYIVDARMQSVPPGVAGELCIGGTGLAKGYLNQPHQTAERFVANPFAKDALVYRTGDLARFLPDGNIEFMGRIDHQVKIRGFRVEPAEIEAVLKQHPAVRQSVIVPYEDKAGDRRLAAYIVSALKPKSEELRAFLAQHLPEYMVPSAFVVLKSLPLTPNGKVDVRALPNPEQQPEQVEREFVLARNPEEQKIVAIWTEVLKLDRVGVTDNFFELGGHSLLATQIISRIRNTFRVQMPLHSFLQTPTVAGLAEKIATCPAAESEEEEMARMLAELEGVSDEDAERLLAADLKKNEDPKSN